MADGAADVQTLLGKMAKPAGAGFVPLREAFALPLRRAAEAGARLDLNVSDVASISGDLPDLLTDVQASDLIFALQRDGAPVAVTILSVDLVLALVEMQTAGGLVSSADEDHMPTAADSALAAPFIDAMLALFAPATSGTALDGTCDGLSRGARLEDARAVELALAKGRYSGARATCVYGERNGAISLILPPAPTPQEQTEDVSGWKAEWSPAVARIPARLDAVLHRLRVPLSDVESWQVDQVVALPGASVSGLRLETPDGRLVTRARLGQCSGHRAARVELPPAPQMDELASGGGAVSDGMLLDDGMTLDAEPVSDGGFGGDDAMEAEAFAADGFGGEDQGGAGDLGGMDGLPDGDDAPMGGDFAMDDLPEDDSPGFDPGGFGMDLPEE